MRRSVPVLRLLAAASVAAAAARCRAPTTAENAGRSATITAAGIARWIERLADDSMRGRATPSRELEGAAATVAAHFREVGLQPAFPGNRFLIHFPVPPWGPGPDSAPNAGAIRFPVPPWGTGPDSAPIAGATLRGSDGRLAGEVVVLIAHVDGKGVGPPVGLDSIYNGADDNASGTAAVLVLAQAFAGTAPHPRRTLLFLVVSGEEHGLWGSRYYADNPTVPVDSIVAVLNFDMISRNTPDSIQAGGLDRSSLGAVLEEVEKAHAEEGLHVTPGPISGSDQVPFSAEGVPFLFFFAGLHADYHTPLDEADRTNADKAARVARLAFHAALAVADADARPQWLPGGRPTAQRRGRVR